MALGLNPAHFDFAVLSHCNASVFDYGTYGFWSSYLAGGESYLARGFGKTLSSLVKSIQRAGLDKKNYHFVDVKKWWLALECINCAFTFIISYNIKILHISIFLRSIQIAVQKKYQVNKLCDAY